MYLMLEECRGNFNAAANLYAERYPNRNLPNANVIQRLDQRIRETGRTAPAPVADRPSMSVRKRLYLEDVPVRRSERKLNSPNILSFSGSRDEEYSHLAKFTNCQVKLSRMSDALLLTCQNISLKLKAESDSELERKGASSEETNIHKLIGTAERDPRSESSSVIEETELSSDHDCSYGSPSHWKSNVCQDWSQILFSDGQLKLSEKNNVTAGADILEYNGNCSSNLNEHSSPNTFLISVENGNECTQGDDCLYSCSGNTQEFQYSPNIGHALKTVATQNANKCLKSYVRNKNVSPQKVSNKDADNYRNIGSSTSLQNPTNSTKKMFCIFCKNVKTNLLEHYKRVHQNEDEVRKMLNPKEMSVEHSQSINKIYFDNNMKGIFEAINEGEIICKSSGAEKTKSSRSKKYSYSKKREFCIFCKETKTNIARHFELCHQDEKEVLKFLKLEKGSRKRAELLSKLRNEGNFKYNIENPEKPILVRRRHIYGNPENPKQYFLPCPSCKAFLSYRQTKHYQICSKVPTQKGTIRSVTRDARLLTADIHPIANKILKYKIMPPMRNDKIFDIIKNDRLILLFGNYLTPKYTAHQEYIIRQRLRFLGRFLIIVKQECSEIKKLEYLFRPQYFESAIQSVYKLGELSSTTSAFIKPKLALEMVQCLKMCARILESTYIKEGNDRRRKNVNKFLKLLETESASRINKPAHRDLVACSRQNKIKKQGNLPLSDDITKFKCFLLERAQNIHQNLLVGPFSHVLWRQLAELTLLYIAVYNRKRSGESHRILVEDFLNIHPLASSAIPEELEILDKSDKEKAQITYKLVIRGKLDRTICAFIPQNVKLFLDYIYEHRANAKVADDNPYLFGLPGKLSGIRHKTLGTCFLMRKYTSMAKLCNPLHVRTTLLRKHLATKVSTLNLQDAQQEMVHDFMGHHGNIHKGFYRQQVITKDLMMYKILDQDIGCQNASSTSDRDECNGYRKLEIKRKMMEIKKNPKSKYATATARVESSTDGENEAVYTRNLHIIQTTPIRPKRNRKKHSPKQREILQELENAAKYPIKQPDDPIAANNSDDPTVKSIDLENSTSEDEDDIKMNCYQPNTVRNLEGIKGKAENAIPRIKWRTPQKRILQSLFNDYIDRGIYPPGHQIQSAIDTYPELVNRTVATTKSFLQHEIKKRSYSSSY